MKKTQVVGRERMLIENLEPAPYNPRKITGEEYDALRASIEKFGLVQPIVWNRRSGLVVGGHQRLDVVRELGWTEVDVVVVDLAEAEEKALNLALNSEHLAGNFLPSSLEPLLEELRSLPDEDLFAALRLDELEPLPPAFRGSCCVEALLMTSKRSRAASTWGLRPVAAS
jgi:hypothetical protein